MRTNLLAKGETNSLVIQALNTIGQTKVDEKIIAKIRTLLQKGKIENLINEARLDPAWINKILTKSVR